MIPPAAATTNKWTAANNSIVLEWNFGQQIKKTQADE